MAEASSAFTDAFNMANGVAVAIAIAAAAGVLAWTRRREPDPEPVLDLSVEDVERDLVGVGAAEV